MPKLPFTRCFLQELPVTRHRFLNNEVGKAVLRLVRDDLPEFYRYSVSFHRFLIPVENSQKMSGIMNVLILITHCLKNVEKTGRVLLVFQ